MDQATLASQIALRQSLTHEGLAKDAVAHSEGVAHRTASKQLLKAAAELVRGNLPAKIVQDGVTYYIVESRSTFVGRLVDMDVSTKANDLFNHMVFEAISDYTRSADYGRESGLSVVDLTLKFAVTGGDPYLVCLRDMSCTCKHQPGELCWHFCLCDVWEQAGAELAEGLPTPEAA